MVMDWKVILDLLVSVLLIATIGYAVRLNARLTQLRKNRDDMAKIIVSFNEATVRAESSIPKLRKAAEDAGQALQERVEKAQSLRDDLAFMIERADTMANRLESGVRSARGEIRSDVRGDVRGTAGGPSAPMAAPSSSFGPAPRLGGSKGAAVAAAAAASEAGLDDDRSEAERELLRALQSMR
jgi:cell division septum initiation protein DivIVA